ncbi:ComEA family DNA-binding protein [uncultured Ruthenibacterium sp.]|uniref:ComEA family DNA-binding protein n=1 Tax=uncultured Ruthenibacterium sp. TaxID=1905347 RepID=UPI00349E8CD0
MHKNVRLLLCAFCGCLVFLMISLMFSVPWTSGEAVPISAYFQEQEDKINVNTAPVLELMCLEGIGEKRAKAIVTYREEHGTFSCVEDLKEIPGISNGILEKIKDDITF